MKGMEPMATVVTEVHVREENGVGWITIDHPPVNVLTMALLGKLERDRKSTRLNSSHSS